MITDEERNRDYNKDGSWLFPPSPRSAGQFANFWLNAQIPDEVLTNLIKTFRQRTLDNLKPHSAQMEKDFSLIWRASNPANLAGRFFQAIDSETQARKRVELETYTLSRAQDFLGYKPIEIDRMDVRTIARAGMMYAAPGRFSVADRDWVRGYPLGLSTGPTTVEGIEEMYKLQELQSALQSPPDTIADVLAELGALSEKVTQVSLKIDSLDTKIGQR